MINPGHRYTIKAFVTAHLLRACTYNTVSCEPTCTDRLDYGRC